MAKAKKRKPLERKRLGQNMREQTFQPDFVSRNNAIQATRKRAERGEAPSTVSFKIPPRLQLALQVREVKNSPWGVVKAYPINTYTPDELKEEYKEKLLNSMRDWIMNGYFGPNASFKVAEVKTQPITISY